MEESIEQFGFYDPKLDLSFYHYPPIELLDNYAEIHINTEDLEAKKLTIVSIFKSCNIEIDYIKAIVGPTVTLFAIIPYPGVKISRIKSLENDIALSFTLRTRVTGQIPGTYAVGIEVDNEIHDIVSMRSVLMTENFQKTNMDLPIVLGKSMTNEVFVADLAKMPHLLIAGATGQGKSVALNAMLISLLYKKHPSQLKFVLIDTNQLEFSMYNKISRHFLAQVSGESEAVITKTDKAVNVLNSLCLEMDQRYDLLKDALVRNVNDYNDKFIHRKLNSNHGHRFLPFIVVVIDEFSNLISPKDKIVESLITRIAQLGRAIGIHLIISTQRPTVNIITGIIKANFPSRIAFRVSSATDSRTILDSGDAEYLNGRGDMLFSNGVEKIHLQGAFASTDEVDRISEFIGNQRGYAEAYQLPGYLDQTAQSIKADFDPDDRDSMFEDAARLIVMHQRGSTSLIQRKLKLGYNRSGRIIEQLEAAGVVGPFEGSKAREVLIPDDYALGKFLNGMRK